MENLLYIAAIIAAVAFLILCISLAMTLFSVKKTLNNVADTLDGSGNKSSKYDERNSGASS